MIVGDNGILTRAKEAKTETEEAENLEKVQLAVAGSFTTDGKYDLAKVESELEISDEDITNNEDGTYTVKYNGKEYIISETGEVTEANWTQNGSEITNNEGVTVIVVAE